MLLGLGHEVTVYDILYFGSDFLPLDNKNLKLVKGDIRDTKKIKESCKGHDIFISLACISNDASFVLDEQLSTSVNLDAFEPMVLAAKESGVRRFIYASSSSVYGVSDQKDVKEDHPLLPLTLYNKYKGMCEPILLEKTDNNFEGVVFRPATVCGYAPRLRLDLSVNILTNHAITNNKITVFGGDQLRPNLHVQDYCEAVILLMNSPANKIKNQIFNIGYQNLSIREIANVVKKIVQESYKEKPEILIETTSSDDNRSYHINSDRIKEVLDYTPKLTIEDAVRELCYYFKNGSVKDSFEDINYFNVKKLMKINAK